MPKERHLFFQWARSRHHAIYPPQGHAPRFEHIGTQAIEEFVHHWLQAAGRSWRQDFHPKGLPFGSGDPHRFRPARREWVHARIP